MSEESERPEPDPGRRPLRARLPGIAFRLALVVLFLEVALRVGVWFVKDRNPYYLFYGFQGAVSQAQVSPWSVYDGQYFKYPPGYELQGAAGQHGETAHINALGFRGPDFEPAKAPGTYRVVCMGGSSTFGFHNDDDQTYPHHLQRLFDAQASERRFEVINAGFPYYNSATIRGLFEEELVGYGPDLVTLYCGYNDASWPLETSALTRLTTWLQQRSILCYVAKETVLTDKRFYSLVSRLERLLPGQQGTDPAEIERLSEAAAARLRANVESLGDTAAAHGAAVLLIRQPITVVHQHREFAGFTYQQEVDAIRAKLAARGRLTVFETRLLVHRRLVDELDAIAAERGWPVVDNIALLDEDRRRLASWVHLVPEANERLAAALHARIEELVGE